MFTFVFFAVLFGGHIWQGSAQIYSERLCEEAEKAFVQKLSVINPITGMPKSDHIETMCLRSEPLQP